MRQAVNGNTIVSPTAMNGSKPQILLRNDAFELRCNVLGHTTQEARAEFIGMNFRALMWARRGRTCGPKLIAHTLSAFERHADRFAELNLPITFEAIFETVAPTAEVKS